MRRFRIYRPNPPDDYQASGVANAPDEVQLEGCMFSDGTVSIRWLTQFRSFSNWATFAEFEAVHGHPEYGTIVQWLDGEDGEQVVQIVRQMADTPTEYVKAYQVLMDLDRCTHGRHSVDSCLMCPGGKSTGNLILTEGEPIGHTVHGHYIVPPDPRSEDFHDPAKWIRLRD